ncbi:MAG: large subunit ribosomal protein L24 [Candidatus Berkelbacteria bacterium Licking1014_2]|uniref:Large ribosomal subunit protein uL24 n=1 Tax=Candidatus Berkelbacteria bacterium Licking1014_2 TaxID=2017146 RepID=A0A554LWY4_9BACT|nr:MAG: large subunit ribosomal protein L24 [Candidatus Berkelbacteria bacterium Licking1014_2]
MEKFKFKLKRGDMVLILAGKDKGKTGKILKINRQKKRLVVEGVNLVKKHLKPSQKYPQGGIIDSPAPLAYSNASLLCPHCQKPTKIASQITGDEKHKRLRLCQKCHQTI